MCMMRTLSVFCEFILVVNIFHKIYTSAEENVKIWKPNNDIFSRDNWVDPNAEDDCGKVEFGKINTAVIFLTNLTAKEFILPVTGELGLLNDKILEVVDADSSKKTHCLKLKEIKIHKFTNPDNWESDLSKNPAVPDMEKLPCEYDKIIFPNGIYSGVSITGAQRVSSIVFDNFTFYGWMWVFFENTEMGKTVFDNSDSPEEHLIMTPSKCDDPAGCTCNKEPSMQCPPKKEVECLNPVMPRGFCHSICGAYITFMPKNGFNIQKMKKTLEKYSDIYTHVGKTSRHEIQVVFTEEKYTGDSVVYAKGFRDHIVEKMQDYKIMKVSKLELSGSRTSGDSSLLAVFFLSLLFVVGTFGIIFYVYGDYKLPVFIGLTAPSSLPLSSTYRARFGSGEDESELIIGDQSLAGSVMNLDQSFDNPLYGQVSTDPNLDEDEQTSKSETKLPKSQNHEIENNRGDILYNLTKLNQELKEEMSSEAIEEIPSTITLETAPTTDVDEALLNFEEEN